MGTINVVIMAGGSGTRFWPLSQEILPKQFISLVDNETLIQRTYGLYRKWLTPEQIFVATSKKYRNIVHEQLPELPSDQLILEPVSRDTAASIALTARHFLSRDSDDVLVFAPSDHYVLYENHLMQSLLRAAEFVQEEPLAILTVGVVPTRPETGYGYIRRQAFPKRSGVYEVLSFIEKPDKARAEALLKEQNVLWNSGIIVWKPSAIRHYMSKFQPDLWNCVTQGGSWEHRYAELPKISVDYAVLEKADSIYTFPCDFYWDDIGVWTALERLYLANSDGNITLGCNKDEVIAMEADRNIIYLEQGKAAVLGVSDLIIVSTSNGLLICNKAYEQKVKHLIPLLNKNQHS